MKCFLFLTECPIFIRHNTIFHTLNSDAVTHGKVLLQSDMSWIDSRAGKKTLQALWENTTTRNWLSHQAVSSQHSSACSSSAQFVQNFVLYYITIIRFYQSSPLEMSCFLFGQNGQIFATHHLSSVKGEQF